VHNSGRDEDVVVRLDFGVGSKLGEVGPEEEESDFVGVRGRLKDMLVQSVRQV